MIPDELKSTLSTVAKGSGLVVALTGAGISAESGIPTFRGPEGYWRVGSKNYQPEELATFEAFSEMPDEIWAWYLYRRAACLAAEPNDAHRALADLERAYGDRFVLVTQNVDGLHLREGGNSEARTFQIHGNIDFMRCAAECHPTIWRIPGAIDRAWTKDRALGDEERKVLRCTRCGQRGRPHVLWFDESYDEARFRFESSLRAAYSAALLVVVGTSGATNLPLQVGSVVARRGAPIVVINVDESPFTRMAASANSGFFLQGSAGSFVPQLVQTLVAEKS